MKLEIRIGARTIGSARSRSIAAFVLLCGTAICGLSPMASAINSVDREVEGYQPPPGFKEVFDGDAVQLVAGNTARLQAGEKPDAYHHRDVYFPNNHTIYICNSGGSQCDIEELHFRGSKTCDSITNQCLAFRVFRRTAADPEQRDGPFGLYVGYIGTSSQLVYDLFKGNKTSFPEVHPLGDVFPVRFKKSQLLARGFVAAAGSERLEAKATDIAPWLSGRTVLWPSLSPDANARCKSGGVFFAPAGQTVAIDCGSANYSRRGGVPAPENEQTVSLVASFGRWKVSSGKLCANDVTSPDPEYFVCDFRVFALPEGGKSGLYRVWVDDKHTYLDHGDKQMLADGNPFAIRLSTKYSMPRSRFLK